MPPSTARKFLQLSTDALSQAAPETCVLHASGSAPTVAKEPLPAGVYSRGWGRPSGVIVDSVDRTFCLVVFATAFSLGACDDREPLGPCPNYPLCSEPTQTPGSGGASSDAGVDASVAGAGAEARRGAGGASGGAGHVGAAGTSAGGAQAADAAPATSAGVAGTTGAAGSTDATSDRGAIPACSSKTVNSKAMDATDFCKIFLSVCGTMHTGYADMTTCVATYSELTATKPVRQQCQSYHLCNADSGTGAARITHCAHAAAEVLCTQAQ
jgi:hypothetical protein